MKEFSPTMRVDVLVSDWKAGLDPVTSEAEREQQLYGKAWEAYRDGDYGFGLWCWHECDRLTNNLNGNIREVTRVLGPGRYFGFSHRKAVAKAVPIERIYRPRKGDMSTPRTDAFALPHYQVLCVYLAHADAGDPKARALLEIALGELEDRVEPTRSSDTSRPSATFWHGRPPFRPRPPRRRRPRRPRRPPTPPPRRVVRVVTPGDDLRAPPPRSLLYRELFGAADGRSRCARWCWEAEG